MYFFEALKVMLWGMLGIFIVLTCIFFLIKLLLKVFPEK